MTGVDSNYLINGNALAIINFKTHCFSRASSALTIEETCCIICVIFMWVLKMYYTNIKMLLRVYNKQNILP